MALVTSFIFSAFVEPQNAHSPPSSSTGLARLESPRHPAPLHQHPQSSPRLRTVCFSIDYLMEISLFWGQLPFYTIHHNVVLHAPCTPCSSPARPHRWPPQPPRLHPPRRPPTGLSPPRSNATPKAATATGASAAATPPTTQTAQVRPTSRAVKLSYVLTETS